MDVLNYTETWERLISSSLINKKHWKELLKTSEKGEKKEAFFDDPFKSVSNRTLTCRFPRKKKEIKRKIKYLIKKTYHSFILFSCIKKLGNVVLTTQIFSMKAVWKKPWKAFASGHKIAVKLGRDVLSFSHGRPDKVLASNSRLINVILWQVSCPYPGFFSQVSVSEKSKIHWGTNWIFDYNLPFFCANFLDHSSPLPTNCVLVLSIRPFFPHPPSCIVISSRATFFLAPKKKF